MKPACLFLTGFLMELIWAAGTLSLQNKAYWMAFMAAAVAPYVAGVAQAWTVVDEQDWRKRLRCISWYAAGAVCGLACTLPWWS